MISALISFLGGSAFRLIFGATMDWFNKRQDHKQEMELLRAQAESDDKRAARDLERIRLQADLKVSEVKVMGDVAEQKAMADAFLEAVQATREKTGIAWVDAWNGSIRPAGATVSLTVWVGTMIAAGMVLSDYDKTLIAAFLGIFVGDRIHNNMRK